MDELRIRAATTADAPELLAIYAPYVRETAITFEYEAPSVAEFAERIANVLKKYPYLAAERSGEIVGYAYAGPFKTRAAYGGAAYHQRKRVHRSAHWRRSLPHPGQLDVPHPAGLPHGGRI